MIADQLSVHANPGRNKHAIPFAVVVQSNRFRHSVRRVAVPLVAVEEFRTSDSDVGPLFVIGDLTVVLDPLQITNVPRDALGLSVSSLVNEEGRIVNALNALLSRAWR